MSLLILVVDDEPDVEALFRQQFRRDIAAGRFVDGVRAVGRRGACCRSTQAEDVSLILILSDINMPGMSGLELLPKAKASAARRAGHHDHRLWRRGDQAQGAGERRRGAADQADRLCDRCAARSRRGSGMAA